MIVLLFLQGMEREMMLNVSVVNAAWVWCLAFTFFIYC